MQKPDERVPDGLVKLNFKSVGAVGGSVPAMAFSAIKERITPSRFQGLAWAMSVHPTSKVPARFMTLKT